MHLQYKEEFSGIIEVGQTTAIYNLKIYKYSLSISKQFAFRFYG